MAVQADRAREAPVAALHEMEARLTARAACGFLAGDEDAVALADDPDRGGIDAGQIHRDLQGIVGFVDVERRGTLASLRLGAEGAAKLDEDLADLGSELTDFRGEWDGMNAGRMPDSPIDTGVISSATI